MVPYLSTPPRSEDECDCPTGPDRFHDFTAGHIICRNCGVILSQVTFGQPKPPSPDKTPWANPKRGFISPDLFRAFRLNHPHSYQHRRWDRVEQEIKQYWRSLELPDSVRDRAIFLAQRYLQTPSKATSLQARARVCVYYAMLEAKIPVVMTVFESHSLSAAFLRREYANLLMQLHLPPVTTGWVVYLETLASKLRLEIDVVNNARTIMDKVMALERTQACSLLGIVAGAIYVSCKLFQLPASVQIIATAANISPELLRVAVKRVELVVLI